MVKVKQLWSTVRQLASFVTSNHRNGVENDVEDALLSSAEQSDDACDRLILMYDQQRSFMELLQKKRNFPEFPVDLASKAGQKACKQVAYDTMGELFEAIVELKNSKDHRMTDVKCFDREHYVEELVDGAHFLMELIILSGVTVDEFFDAYMKKGEINRQRIENGY